MNKLKFESKTVTLQVARNLPVTFRFFSGKLVLEGVNRSHRVGEYILKYFARTIRTIYRNMTQEDVDYITTYILVPLVGIPYNEEKDLVTALVEFLDEAEPLQVEECIAAEQSVWNLAGYLMSMGIVDVRQYYAQLPKKKLHHEEEEVTLRKTVIDEEGNLKVVEKKDIIVATLFEPDFSEIAEKILNRPRASINVLLVRVTCPTTAKTHYILVEDNEENRKSAINAIASTFHIPKELLEEGIIDKIKLYRHGDVVNVVYPKDIEIKNPEDTRPLTRDEYLKILVDHV